jgi:hypothetical protein
MIIIMVMGVKLIFLNFQLSDKNINYSDLLIVCVVKFFPEKTLEAKTVLKSAPMF